MLLSLDGVAGARAGDRHNHLVLAWDAVTKCGRRGESSHGLDVLGGGGGWVGEFECRFRKIEISKLALDHEGVTSSARATISAVAKVPSQILDFFQAKAARTIKKKA